MIETGTLILAIGAFISLVAAGFAVRVDIQQRRLPNQVVAVSAAASWATSAVLVVTESSTVLRVALCVGVVAGPLLLLWLVAPSTIGAGDVKLAAALAPLLAWPSALHPITALLAMFVLATPLALAATLRNRAATVAFGPYITAGVAVVVLANVLLP